MNKNALNIRGMLALAAALSIAAAAQAKPVTYTIDDPKARDVVSFTSDAPVELIVGHTSKIKGSVTLDDSLDLSKPFQANFDVDLASVDTGIELRNEHMRDNFLETKKYPNASFKVTSVSATPTVLKDKQTVTTQAVGEFSLHGKTAKRTIPVDVTYFKNCVTTQGKYDNCDLIQIKAKFPVAFKDHAINRPQVVFQKLADTVFVTVAATARRELGAGASKTSTSEKTPAAETKTTK